MERTALRIKIQFAQTPHPALLPVVVPDDPVIPFEAVMQGHDMLQQVLPHFLALFGHHQLQPAVDVFWIAVIDPEDLVQHPGATPDPRGDIKFVRAEPRDLLGLPEEVFGFPKGRFHLIAFGNVVDN